MYKRFSKSILTENHKYPPLYYATFMYVHIHIHIQPLVVGVIKWGEQESQECMPFIVNWVGAAVGIGEKRALVRAKWKIKKDYSKIVARMHSYTVTLKHAHP